MSNPFQQEAEALGEVKRFVGNVNRKIEELEAENERLRKKHREFHRRVQQAEAAVPKWQELLEIVKQNKQGVTSFSRLLLTSGLQQAWEENERLRGLLSETVEHLNEGWDCSELVDRIEEALEEK